MSETKLNYNKIDGADGVSAPIFKVFEPAAHLKRYIPKVRMLENKIC